MRTFLTVVLITTLSTTALAGDSAEKLSVGDPAPEIVLDKLLQTTDGPVVNWQALKGRVVVLEFWAT